MKKYIVGTNHTGYPQIRNFYSLPFKYFRFKKYYDWCKIIDHISYKYFGNNHQFFHNYHNDVLIPFKPDLYHFWNSVSTTHKPWIVSHEANLPRYNINIEKGLLLLSGQYCKKIISFCQKARNYLLLTLEKFPQYKDDILAKNVIIHPPQKLFINTLDDKIYDRHDIIFTIIGTTFFQKGGFEVVKVFDRLLKEKSNVKLNIISKLAYNMGYKDNHITKFDYDYVLKIIGNYPRNIAFYPGLNNSSVIEILKKSHVGLLPSYGETYGYTVLEAQACGCPVITTEMPPFEEFNNDNCGWRIKVPLIERDGIKTSDVYSKKGLKEFSKTLEENLYQTIKDILKNSEVIKVKAKKAIENINRNNNLEKITEQIENIYKEALNI